MNIMVTKHALERHMLRVGTGTTAVAVEHLFKKVPYRVIEPADEGAIIVELKSVIWVIHRTSSRITVVSCYGPASLYTVKRPHLAAEATTYDAIRRWMSRQDRIGERRAFGC